MKRETDRKYVAAVGRDFSSWSLKSYPRYQLFSLQIFIIFE